MLGRAQGSEKCNLDLTRSPEVSLTRALESVEQGKRIVRGCAIIVVVNEWKGLVECKAGLG